MYCPNCRCEEIDNSTVFCPNCGIKISDLCSIYPSEPSELEKQSKKQKKKNKIWKIIITIFIIILVLPCVLMIVSGASKIIKSSKENKSADNIIAEEDEVFPDSSLYDNVLAYGDGYYLVKKYDEDYNYASMKFGVLDIDGNWLLPLSDNNIFGNVYKNHSENPGNKSIDTLKLAYKYIGDGVFIYAASLEIRYPDGTFDRVNYKWKTGFQDLSVYCYNAKINREFTFKATKISPYENGYLLAYESKSINGLFYKVDTVGNKTELPATLEHNFPAYSEGLFFANKRFYNIDGEIVIDLSWYDIIDTDLYFSNGKCEFKFKNPGGSTYKAVIDKSGKFIEEPHRN